MKRPLFPSSLTATQGETKRRFRDEVYDYNDMVDNLHWHGTMLSMDGEHKKWTAWVRHKFLQDAREERLRVHAVSREMLIPIIRERELVDRIIQYLG